MLSSKYELETELDEMVFYDPFLENRGFLSIRRGGSRYKLSYVDINNFPANDYTIICVHGWGASSLNYSYLLKLLGPHFRTIAYDLKGHGFSEKEPDTYDLDSFTDELAQVIDHFQPKNLVLVGHSMGTAIIQNYMSLYSNKVRAAVVLSGAPDFREPFPRIIPKVVFRMDERLKNLLLEVGMRIVASNTTHPKYTDALKEQRKNTPYYVFRNSLLNTVFEWKKEEDLRNIEVPVLIMVGENDHLTSVKDSLKLRELLPNSRLIILPNSKHDIILDQGKSVSELIREFIEYQIDLDKINCR